MLWMGVLLWAGSGLAQEAVSGEEQERSCIMYVAQSLQPSIWSQSDQADPKKVSKDALERLIRIALDDPSQVCSHMLKMCAEVWIKVEAWGLTEPEVFALRKLKGKTQLFQLTDDLRSKVNSQIYK